MTFIQTVNPRLIRAALSIDDSYEKIAYDNSPKLRDYHPDTENKLWFILLKDTMTAGIIMLEPVTNVTWIPHIIIYKQYRGPGSEEWGKQIAQYVRNNYGARKFLAFTPYESAKKYAERIGFKQVHVLTKSVRKNGELLDQYVLEMT